MSILAPFPIGTQFQKKKFFAWLFVGESLLEGFFCITLQMMAMR
jgi:hypothetical protein